MTSEVPDLPGLSDLSLLGRGGLADVYLARQQHLERWVAAKVFRVTLADDQAAERFRAECRAIGRLDQYPHVLTVYDAGVLADGRPYLISERCDGSLHDLVGMRGPLPVDRVAALGSTIGRALRFAHSAGMLHGDVTPQNLLLRTSGAPVLADFGLAVLRDHAPTAAGFTLLHAAPEALQPGVVIDERADVYGLGSTLYTVLTGAPPFPPRPGEDDAAYRSRARDEPAPRPDGVTDQMAGLLSAMLAFDPDHRPSTDEVITALETTPGRGTRPAPSGGTLSATRPETDLPVREPVANPGRTPRTDPDARTGRIRTPRVRRSTSTPRPWDTRVSRPSARAADEPSAAMPPTSRAGTPACEPGAPGTPAAEPAPGIAPTPAGPPAVETDPLAERPAAVRWDPLVGMAPLPRPADPPESVTPSAGPLPVERPETRRPDRTAATAQTGSADTAGAATIVADPRSDDASGSGALPDVVPSPTTARASSAFTPPGRATLPSPLSTLVLGSVAGPADLDLDVDLDAVAAPVRFPGTAARRRRRRGTALVAAGGAAAALAVGTVAVAAWRVVDGLPDPASAPSADPPHAAPAAPVTPPRTTQADLPPASVLPGSTLGVVRAPQPTGRTATPQRTGTTAPQQPSTGGTAQRPAPAARPAAPVTPRRTADPAPSEPRPAGGAPDAPARRSPPPAPPAPATPDPQPPSAQGLPDPTTQPRPEIPYR
ncbi:serine/threonine-protein kinase [Pseudonocardia endophytica]|uniref:serine/threonine-protein kinase n=1 Tax=Pseudonocardia endophytica TaxID=401976 RepID=UPI0014043425|nr:serine/threonine-protein kinase [Pseudonocardia endophytica]